MARRLGPAKPRGVTWNGAGGCVIVSQSRQENFSRTVWITFHWRGITSSVSVMSSPSFDSFVEPQHGQLAGAGITMRSRGRCSGTACAPVACAGTIVRSRSGPPPSRPPAHPRSPSPPALRAEAPSAPTAAPCAPSECRKAARRSFSISSFSGRSVRLPRWRIGEPGLRLETGGALGEDHRMRGGKIGWQRFKWRCHAARESYSPASAKHKRHPTEVGRQVSCG